MVEVGFIGLGSMGAAMAGRLLERGHPVRVWNRSKGPVSELVDRGASAAAEPADAFAGGIVLSMLANDAAALAVFDDQVLTAHAGAIHVNLASVSPAAARELADRHADAGVAYVSAPVLGRPPVAAAGQLNILAAGAGEAVRQVEPLLRDLSSRVWHLGEAPPQANIAKVAMNYMLIHTIQSLGESISLVERGGIEPEAFVDLATNTMFGGLAHQIYGRIIASRQYRPAGFSLTLGAKDLGLAESLAREEGFELPLASGLRALFDAALADPELDGADWAALTEVTRGR